ncbi:MAG: cytochrome c biogenesis protein CcsA [Opitutaceae bacterium]|nr:cytochrome c biogenesis protein CcsA [Opitutaceae bacterium]
MKKILPIVVLVAALLYVARTLLPPSNPGAFDIAGFGRLPVLANGRIKPLDTVARSSLLQLQARQRVSSPNEGQHVSSPTEWLLDVTFRSEKADTYPTFTIDSPELLALIGKTEESLKINYTSTAKKTLAVVGFLPGSHRRFSFTELKPHLQAIQDQARLANQAEAATRSVFQRAVLQLYSNLIQYERLRHALVMPGRPDFLGDLLKFQEKLTEGVAAVRARQAGQPNDEAAVNAMTAMGENFVVMSERTNYLVIPPERSSTDPTAWRTAGAALLETFRTGQVDSSALAYSGLAHAWRNQQPQQFNKVVELFRADLAKRFAKELKKSDAEARFNAAQPFYTSMSIYAVAFFFGIFSWLKWPDVLGRSAFWLVAVAWVIATAGIATRMWLEGRPPVTNLYSSALFVGWLAVGLCLVLEVIYKNGVPSVAAGVVGFATLQIAHHLSLSGDTLEMMRAVLDSNFWLATHVVVVTAGYSATFLAGFLALIYIFRGVFTRSLDKVTADSLTRMTYGIICFATLASFVGTVLGGIWADQSWGRFWGWDPKENGALLIVMWNALILHARWGGMVGQRGLMSMAVFGNVVTSWSWFGTNMLGVGLHSYGFTDAAFWSLSAFVLSQVVIIAIAQVPLARWRSFRRPVHVAPPPQEIASSPSAL